MNLYVKDIPAALQAHLDGFVTFSCRLLKIRAQNGTVMGLTSLDVDVTYNDGGGDVIYKAPLGFDSYQLESSAGLDVDNAEATVLLADSGAFSDEEIDAGALDYGMYWVYRINWDDPTQGHEMVDYGTIGIIRAVHGVAGVLELRSLAQQVKQTYESVYSKTCRAKFGSGGSSGCVRKNQCGFDAESLWQTYTVSSVGAEDDLEFTANSAPSVSGPNGPLSFVPGLVRWTTGNNAGRTYEINAVDGATITLSFGTEYSIQIGDEFQARPDCDHTWETCRDHYDNIEHFRGEPFIAPVDESSSTSPNFRGIWSAAADDVLEEIP